MEKKSSTRNRRAFIAALLIAFGLQGRAADYTVYVYSYFSPSTLQIHVGDTVTWDNEDSSDSSHTTTSNTSLWNGLMVGIGDTYSRVFNSVGTFPYHDQFDGFSGSITVTAAVNSPPSVSVTNPVNNAVFSAPANIKIDATAADTDGSISSVEFFSGTTSLGTKTAPYSLTLSNVAVGTYVLTAKATDNLGATTTSSAITVTVTSIGLDSAKVLNKQFQFNATGLVSGKTNLLQASTNLASPANWISIATNVAPLPASFIDTKSSNFTARFYRVVQLP